ncbi:MULTISPECIES: hypothetical protein [unclassified Streptomyces]|uniref:hypothetical protein n=1 Tax=unclassified Streptomyces TaxID=2593676 RepID=UPI000CD4F7BE|nr:MULTISPECIES: hypothetical protein [unclassified Streptomyces]AWL39661.1 hypothetical protein B9S64_17340 [Streptomyces sp. SM18]
MPILAGQVVTAQQLNRLQPKTYRAVATSALSGAATNADVPGATITLTTETANAVYVVDAWFDYRVTSTSGTALGSGNVAVDGAIQGEYAVFRDSHAGSGASFTDSVGHTYRGTIPTPGTHTLKLVASPSAGQQVNVYSSITVTIYEVV